MKLPQLKQTETFEAKIGDYTFTFRKAIISDSFLITELSKETDSINGLLKIIATLMNGYDETVEERLKFLNQIDFSDFSQVTLDINNVLKLAGLEAKPQDTKKKSKK